MKLILASSSLRRQEVLRSARIAFTPMPSNVPEEIRPGEKPGAYSSRLARDKATAVWESVKATDVLVLGADTVVVVDEHILEKPLNDADAGRMLRMISGRSHEVVTSVCLLGDGIDEATSETTLVHVLPISDREIEEYVTTGEPTDKAGGYAIQGMASRWIPRVEGCYFNVVGLPLSVVYRMLIRAGALNVTHPG
jgi:nucleoside triphosphate pyrophosphatase